MPEEHLVEAGLTEEKAREALATIRAISKMNATLAPTARQRYNDFIDTIYDSFYLRVEL